MWVPTARARARPSPVRAMISSRSNSAVCGALHTADYADTAVMRSPTSDAEQAVAQSIDAA
jgi:hypothetical protein